MATNPITTSDQLGNLSFAIADITPEQLSDLLDTLAETIEQKGFECTGHLWFENIDDLEKEVEALLAENKGEGNQNGKEVRKAKAGKPEKRQGTD